MQEVTCFVYRQVKGADLSQTHSHAVPVAARITEGKPATVKFRMYPPGSATTSMFDISMSPVLSDVPVECPVSFGAVRVGGLPGATATATLAVNGAKPTLESVDTPATALKGREKQDRRFTSYSSRHACGFEMSHVAEEHMLSKQTSLVQPMLSIMSKLVCA